MSLLNLVLIILGSGVADAPLTDAEADVIVAAEVQAKAEREAQKPKAEFHVIDHKVVEQKDGMRLIINRVRPPSGSGHGADREGTERAAESFYANRSSELSASPVNSASQLQVEAYQTLALSATVFDRQVTQLNWSHGGNNYTAYSRIDFNYLRGVATIPAPGIVYHLMLGIGNESDTSSLPDLPQFTSGQPEYFVITEEGETLDPAAFAGMDALHAFYAENERDLQTAYERTEALNAARKRHEAAHPETPQDTVINIWRKK